MRRARQSPFCRPIFSPCWQTSGFLEKFFIPFILERMLSRETLPFQRNSVFSYFSFPLLRFICVITRRHNFIFPRKCTQRKTREIYLLVQFAFKISNIDIRIGYRSVNHRRNRAAGKRVKKWEKKVDMAYVDHDHLDLADNQCAILIRLRDVYVAIRHVYRAAPATGSPFLAANVPLQTKRARR